MARYTNRYEHERFISPAITPFLLCYLTKHYVADDMLANCFPIADKSYGFYIS